MNCHQYRDSWLWVNCPRMSSSSGLARSRTSWIGSCVLPDFCRHCCSAGPPSARLLDQGAAPPPADLGGAGVRAVWDANCAFPSRGLPQLPPSFIVLLVLRGTRRESHFSHRDAASRWQARVFEDWLFGGEKRRRGLPVGLGRSPVGSVGTCPCHFPLPHCHPCRR